MSMKKLTRTIQRENAIFEIIASNPIKEFTIPGVRDELKSVYGDDTIHQSVWTVVKRLEKLGLVSLISSVSRTKHYSVVSGTKISTLVNQSIGFSKPPRKTLTVVEDVVSKIDDQTFNPLDYVGDSNYDRIIKKLEKFELEKSNEMVVVVLAIMSHCIKRKTTTFISKDIFIMLNFLSKMTILAKLELLSNKKCIVKAEVDAEGVGYRVNISPVDFNSNIYLGVLTPLSTKVESPADKIAGRSLSTSEVGAGMMDYLKKADALIESQAARIKELETENAMLAKTGAKLLTDNIDLEKSVKELDAKVVTLTSTHEELVKSKGVDSTITLRSMKDLKQVKLGL